MDEKKLDVTEPGLNVVYITEKLLGARYLPQEEGGEVTDDGTYHWHLTAEHVSDLWTKTLDVSWPERVNSEHYNQLWGELLADLNGREGPVQIVIECRYEFGLLDNDGVSQYLDQAIGRGPQYLVAFTEEGDMPMSCVLFKSWEIKELDAEDTP